VAEFVKGKSTDNPKFLKNTPTPVEHGNPECARLRGLAGDKTSGGSQLQQRLMDAFKALGKIGKKES
jgi:hypothetical protein